MAQDTKIEWAHDTENIWIGCTEVHEGCDGCYARVLNHRWGHDNWGNDVPRRMVKKTYGELARLQKLAERNNEYRRVFVGSLMDIFEKPMPLVDSKDEKILDEDSGTLRYSFFRRVDSGEYENLIFLLLTKRPSNINKYIPREWRTNPPWNVMYGASAVNQSTYDDVMRHFQKVNGKKFLSIEPQLAPINLHLSDSQEDVIWRRTHGGNWIRNTPDWIIQGGESGPKKRPFDMQWAHDMRRQCSQANIPYFFKQIDKVQPVPEEFILGRQFPLYHNKTLMEV